MHTECWTVLLSRGPLSWRKNPRPSCPGIPLLSIFVGKPVTFRTRRITCVGSPGKASGGGSQAMANTSNCPSNASGVPSSESDSRPAVLSIGRKSAAIDFLDVLDVLNDPYPRRSSPSIGAGSSARSACGRLRKLKAIDSTGSNHASSLAHEVCCRHCRHHFEKSGTGKGGQQWNCSKDRTRTSNNKYLRVVSLSHFVFTNGSWNSFCVSGIRVWRLCHGTILPRLKADCLVSWAKLYMEKTWMESLCSMCQLLHVSGRLLADVSTNKTEETPRTKLLTG